MTLLHYVRSSNLLRIASPILLLTMILGLVACSSATEETATETEPAPDTASATLPAGWAVRADSGAGMDDHMMMEGTSHHFMMGGPPSDNGTFYNAAWTATGDHTYTATLTQNAMATHPTGYGLMFGGSNLGADNQMYSYFEVRQAGEYYIANRNGADVTAVVPWTANDAIMAEGADGKQMNTLSVQVAGDEVVFSINGTEVNRLPAADLHTDGMYGFRIGHRLDVTVSDVAR